MGVRGVRGGVGVGEESSTSIATCVYLQLKEVSSTVFILLVYLQIAAVKVIRETVTSSFPTTEPLVGLKKLVKGALQHVYNTAVIFPLLLQRGR